jgi:hypothetical protein
MEEIFTRTITEKDDRIKTLEKVLQKVYKQFGANFQESYKYMETIVEDMKVYSKIAFDSLLQRDTLFRTHLGIQLSDSDISQLKAAFAVKMEELIRSRTMNIQRPSEVLRSAYKKEVPQLPPPSIEPEDTEEESIPLLPMAPEKPVPAPKPDVSSKSDEKKSSKGNRSKLVDVNDEGSLDQFFKDLEKGEVKFIKNGDE